MLPLKAVTLTQVANSPSILAPDLSCFWGGAVSGQNFIHSKWQLMALACYGLLTSWLTWVQDCLKYTMMDHQWRKDKEPTAYHGLWGVVRQTYSHREGFSVARLAPVPEALLWGWVTIIMVVHSNLNSTCSKKQGHSAWREQDSTALEF
jgi:hypothetical protein